MSFWRDLGFILLSTFVLGIVSALHIGLTSLDVLNLKVLKEGGTPREQSYAAVVLPIVERHHWLLVSLVIVTAVVLESLPLIMERLLNPYIAFVVSVTAVMFVGELIPQALGAKHALKTGYFLSGFVWLCMILTGIISYPLGKALDCILGEDHGTQRFRRNELKELVKLHGSETNGSINSATEQNVGLGRNDSESRESLDSLTAEEVSMIRGALSLREKKLTERIYTRIDELFSIELSLVLDENLRSEIDKSGHSRIPVYKSIKSNIVGMIHTKKLLAAPPGTAVASFPLMEMPRVSAASTLFQVLNLFRVSGTRKFTRMAIVLDSNQSDTIVGTVTLEDVIDELLEHDALSDIVLPRMNEDSEVVVFDIASQSPSESGQDRNSKGKGKKIYDEPNERDPLLGR